MKNTKLLNSLKNLAKRRISLKDVCEELELNEYEVIALISELRDEGINITTMNNDDGMYLFNQGEVDTDKEKIFKLNTDDNNEFKFIAISDTRIGSKYQQMSILNDIYIKGMEMGYSNVILCGNITEGLYNIQQPYADTTFLDDTLKQVDYITEYYPFITGMTTYFITGYKDEKHMTKNKINIGRRISDRRKDMIYLGSSSAKVLIDNSTMLIMSNKLGKTYTVSYRSQQQIDSFRSEDKPDILLMGGLLQMEKFHYRNVECITVPSVCATTKEMQEKRHTNTVGAWYVTVKTNDRGLIESVKAIDSSYYQTNKNEYLKERSLRIGGRNGKEN